MVFISARLFLCTYFFLVISVDNFSQIIFTGAEKNIKKVDDTVRSSSGPNVDLNERAKELHSRALAFVNQGNYPAALAHFRAAVRATNQSVALYLSDLGVTEMRMGNLEKALHRFRKALKVDPSLKIAKDNINDLSKYISVDKKERKKFRQKHHLTEPINIPASILFQLDALFSTYTGGDSSFLEHPFVVKDFFSIWGLNTKKFLLNELQEQYGNRRVDFYPHNMKEENVHPIFFAMKDAIMELLTPSRPFIDVDASESGI